MDVELLIAFAIGVWILFRFSEWETLDEYAERMARKKGN